MWRNLWFAIMVIQESGKVSKGTLLISSMVRMNFKVFGLFSSGIVSSSVFFKPVFDLWMHFCFKGKV